jgi:hypothetical protein
MTSSVSISRIGALILGAILLTSCSNDGAKSDAVATTAPIPEALQLASSPARHRLMSASQYNNTIAHIFGADIAANAQFAPLQRTAGLLALGAATAGVPFGEMQKLQRAAAAVSAQVVDNGNLDLGVPSHRDSLIPCKPADAARADATCARSFLGMTGRLLYRRPVTEARLVAMVEEAGKSADQLKDFYAGLATVLEGMLISPEVLMIHDRSEPDPERPGRRRLDAYSYAARLSFFLWDSAPDDRVLKAAENGELSTQKGRERVVEMMLASPRLAEGVRGFFDDMMGFDAFDNLAKDASAYPAETGAALTAAREQTLRTIVDHLITKNADYRDLYTTRSTFMSPDLGAIYRVATPRGWVKYEFPKDSPRIGLLTHVSFLASHAHPARSSATRRGKALRELLLCQPVPLPPPNVDFSLVEDPTANFRTARERVGAHLENPVCAGCHRITDPMGLALENFDGAGQYRVTERGVQIDPSGTLDGKQFKDLTGLAEAVRNHPSLPSCLVRRVLSYGTGSPIENADRPLLDYFSAHFAEKGYRYTDLVRQIVLSPAFYDVTESAPEQKSASVAN